MTSPLAGRFGLGARTGSNTDNHFVDELRITTKTAGTAYLESFAPAGPNIRPDAVVNIVLADFSTTVDSNKIQLLFDAADVTSSCSITQSGTNTTIVYDPPGLWASNSTHTVSLTFADSAPNTNTFAYSFRVFPYRTLAPNLAVAAGTAHS